MALEVAGSLQPRPHDRPDEVGPHLDRVELQPPRLVEARLGRAAAGEPGPVHLTLDIILNRKCLVRCNLFQNETRGLLDVSKNA